MKKRIGVITFDFYPQIGGQGKLTYDIYSHLGKTKDFELIVLSPMQNTLTNSHNIFSWTLKTPLKHILFSLMINIWLKKLIKKYQLDVLHINGGPGGVFLFRKTDIPVLYTSHHTYFQQSKYIKSQKWKILFQPLEKYGYKLAKDIIAVSKATKNILVNKYGVPNRKVRLIYNFVDTKVYRPIRAIKKHKESIFFVGRIDKRKGVSDLIDAFSIARKLKPGIKLYIGGKGPDLDEVKAYARNLAVSEDITFLGYIKDEDIPIWYNKCGVFAMTSKFEGFGITALQSIACGTPVVAYNVPGVNEVVLDSRNGFLVQQGDIETFAQKLLEIIDSRSSSTHMKKEGLRIVKNKFSLNKAIKKYEEIYQNI